MDALSIQETRYTYEVIVVDNNTSDIHVIKEKYVNVNFISNPKRNPYSSRNLGVKRAKGKVIAFIDAKCAPHKDWLEVGMVNIKSNDKTILAGHYEVKPASKDPKDLLYGLLYLNNEKNIKYGYGVTTGNLWVHKSAFDLVGPFAEEHISGNDIAWSLKAMSLDYVIEYYRALAVDYPGQSYGQLCKSIPKYMSGIAQQHEQGSSIVQRIAYFLKSLLPLRRKTFKELITYRKLYHLSTNDKCYLWLLAWWMKMRMAKAYLQSSFS